MDLYFESEDESSLADDDDTEATSRDTKRHSTTKASQDVRHFLATREVYPTDKFVMAKKLVTSDEDRTKRETSSISLIIHQLQQARNASRTLSWVSKETEYLHDVSSSSTMNDSADPVFCKRCGATYDNTEQTVLLLMETKVKIHERTCCVAQNRLSCRICEEAMTDLEDMKEHMLRHITDGELICSSCEAGGSKSSTNKTQTYLIRSSTTRDIWRKIRNCVCRDKTAPMLERIPVNCKRCDRVFSHGSVLMQDCIIREKSLATETRIKKYRYICRQCSVEKPRRKELISHILKHIRSKEFTCERCIMEEEGTEINSRKNETF